jgi:hypothetical protein
MSDLDPHPSELGPERRGRFRTALLITVAITFLLVAGMLLLDPFGWHLLDRLRGDYDAALAAIPANSSIYVGVNLLSPNLTRLDDLQGAFRSATTGTGVDIDELRQEVDKALAQELGISVEEDLLPWLGQYLGFAVVTFEPAAFGNPPRFEWVMAVETRDRKATDQFLTKFAQGWSTSTGETAQREVYQGVSLTQFDQFILGRSGRLLLVGSSGDAIRHSIDAQDGDSLADALGYEEAIARLPRGRLLTTFVNIDQFNELLTNIPTPLPRISPENLPTASVQGTAVAVSLVEAGVQLDFVTIYDPAQISALQRQALETRVIEPETAALFPSETLVYVTGKGIDLIWSSLRRALIAELGRADFEESMRLFVQEFSIDPNEQIFPHLDGEAALGILPSHLGTLASAADVDLGAAIVIGTSDQSTLAANMSTFSERIGRPQGGLGTITEHNDLLGLTIYEFETVLVPDLLIAYGVGEGYLLLGSSGQTLRSLRFNGGASLASRPEYQAVWRAFPEEMSPGLYVDLQGLLRELHLEEATNESAADAATTLLRPIPHIAAANTVDGNIAQGRIIIFVETPN